MNERTAGDGRPHDRAAELEQVFRYHLKRDSPSGHWINVDLEHNSEVDHYYQYLGGHHNLTRLDANTRSTAEQFAAENDLDITAKDTNYLTVSFVESPTPEDAETEVALCEHLLEVVYDVTLLEVCSVYEHDGYVGWRQHTD